MTPLEMDAILLALQPFPMERTVNPLGLDGNTFCLFMRGGRSLQLYFMQYDAYHTKFTYFPAILLFT